MTLRSLAVGSWISLAAAGLVLAQDPADPPSRVARLNYMDGTVSFRPGTVEEWAPATTNYPLTTGDHLWVDQNSHAEMRINAAALQLAPQTAFAIFTLDDRLAQFSISQGTVNIRVSRLDPEEAWEIDTPNGAVSLLRPGDYRIDVSPESNVTLVTVRGGDAEVTGGGQSFAVPAGRMLRLAGSDQVAGDLLTAGAPDEWDKWCMARDDRADQNLRSAEAYVPQDMIGAEDLGNYGDWRNEPDYGPVWYPRSMPADWAPYRTGHWAYVVPWGWTWIDDAPWGFAPFHYGRWVRAGYGWVWVPGARVRPVYAPALVAFVGGFEVAIGGGPVAAWVPLGPREVYRPYYRVSDVYVRRVNVANASNVNINITNVTYVNRNHVTVVRNETFIGARPVAVSTLRLPPGAIMRARPVTVVDLHPARESYLGRPVQPGVRVVVPPDRVVRREVVVRRELPASIRPVERVRMAAPARPAEPRNVQDNRPRINSDRPGRTFGNDARPQRDAVPAERPRTEPQVERRPVQQQPRMEDRRVQPQPQSQPQVQQQPQDRPRVEDRRPVQQQPQVDRPRPQPDERRAQPQQSQPQVERPRPQPEERRVEPRVDRPQPNVERRQEQQQQRHEERQNRQEDRRKDQPQKKDQ